MTHSYFLQMGGYVIVSNNEVTYGCLPFVTESLDERGEVASVRLLVQAGTQSKILDRSKASTLAKVFVIIQTGWFVAQSITRLIQGLSITELEATTLAYTVLTVVMYIFWWDKPLDVECPIVVKLAHTAPVPEVPVDSGARA